MRLAAVELLDAAEASGALAEPIDVIFATSLMGAADLRALLPARLRGVPLVLYMHENQASYPLSDHPKIDSARDVHFALTNLTSVLAADLVIWNSAWNRRSFLEGMDAILRKANAVERGDWIERVATRSRVIWPPVEPPPGETASALDKTGRVVWPHRWEHDKGPDGLLGIAERFAEPLDLTFTVLGERFPTTPPELIEFQRRFADRIDHMGYVTDRGKYWAHLAGCDWVLSTARHEYFGIAVVEALLAGCLPWLPQRLSYPEILPPEAHGLSPEKPPRDREELSERIKAHLEPALAPNAVARIDDAMSDAVSG